MVRMTLIASPGYGHGEARRENKGVDEPHAPGV
jgi:hypothetical protein